MPGYQNLTDDEVLQIATEREQLTDDARAVLDSELSRRKLSVSDIETHKEAYDRANELEESRRRLSHSFTMDRSGIGTTFLGKRNLSLDPAGNSRSMRQPAGLLFLHSRLPNRDIPRPQTIVTLAWPDIEIRATYR